MCGIVAYIGKREVYPILIKGLQRLEYRGYDSAGIAILNGDLKIFKKAGKVSDLAEAVKGQDLKGHLGMGHTRWATHGEPNDRNAHPHFSQSKNFAIIHNVIIENYSSIKEELKKRGHEFKSDTDTEVLIHLIEDIYENGQVGMDEAVRLALGEVIGAYAIVVLGKDHSTEMIAARKGSPIVVGVGKDEGEYFVASDATPIIEYTNNVIYLNDGEVAYVKDGKLTVKTIENQVKTPYVQELEMKLEELEKGGYDHFMLKEIYEQPRSIWDSMRGRIDAQKNFLRMGGMAEYENKFANAKRIIIIGCGTSWHAGLVAEYLFEDLARIPVEVEYASEFRYRNPVINEDDIVIPISQSGETADTLAAIELAKAKGATIFGVCNVVGSSIPRATHAGAYTHAGPEIGVASTKAFTAQVTVLTLMALYLANLRGSITASRFQEIAGGLEAIPAKVEQVLKLNDKIKTLAKKFKDSRIFLYLGRGYGFPVALEGALKLKEISYIHAEGYPAAEMKHGPIALVEETLPVVFVATRDSYHEKVISNMQEIKARKGKVIAVINEGDEQSTALANDVITVPEADEIVAPMLSVIPLQLLSYYVGVAKGLDVDKPRNLAKSVTVE